DTAGNWDRFGGPASASAAGGAIAGGFPQVRVLGLAECGTRALIAARLGSYGTSEKALTIEMLPLLGPGMLVLADRNFAGHDLWGQAAATGADLLWRAGSAFALPVRTVLSDGTYLSELAVPKGKRRAGARPITVRVVEYHLLDQQGSPTETFALLSTLLDPDTAPAAELARLYHARWQIENAFAAFKSQLKGDGIVLRSKTPDGAEQELWALLCGYHAIREVICAAAELTDRDPLRISFVAALDAVRGPVGDPAAFPP
ncbi:MAG: IS4 family transposase, partial [Microlunatus sp.]|nr:IS4 family transposase [Microlunatus sp.]